MTKQMPYTYLIGWKHLDKWYYGVRFAKNCNPSELWKTYFTSSKHVKRFVKENGLPDIIQIRKTFDTSERAQLFEYKVLRRLKVTKNNKWLNVTANKSVEIEAALKGAKKPKPFKGNDPRYTIVQQNGINTYKEKKGMYSLTDEQKKERHKLICKAKKQNYKNLLPIYKQAGKKSYQTMLIRGTAKNWSNNGLAKQLHEKRVLEGTDAQTKEVACPKCNKVGQYRAMKRWHFDKCKSNLLK